MSARNCFLVAGVVLAGGAAMALGGEAQPTPAPAPVVREVVPAAKFRHAVEGWRQARAEIRRLRALPPSPFTETDTRTAAALVGVVLGWPVDGALRVARCESLHRPDAWNPTALGGSHASGSWQVLYPSTWRSTDVGRAIDAPFNPYVNAFAAARVWQRQGDSFAEWKDVCIR